MNVKNNIKTGINYLWFISVVLCTTLGVLAAINLVVLAITGDLRWTSNNQMLLVLSIVSIHNFMMIITCGKDNQKLWLPFNHRNESLKYEE